MINPPAPQIRSAPAAALPTPIGSTIPIGGSPGSSGSTPDWASIISGDPGLIQAKAALQAGSVADLAQRDAAIKQSLAEFGDTKLNLADIARGSGLGQNDVNSLWDPTTQALAAKNTAAGTSTEARLQAANIKMQQQITNALNARGLFNSGETGYQQGQQQQNFTNSESDARSSLLKAIQTYQQGYLQAQLARELALAQAYSDAANRAYSNNSSTPPTPPTPPTPATYAGTTPGGAPIFATASGDHYLSDGTPTSAPVYTPSTTARRGFIPTASGYGF